MNRDLHLTWERVGISKNTLSVGVLKSSINPGLSDKSLFSPKNKQSSSIHGVSSVMQWRGVSFSQEKTDVLVWELQSANNMAPQFCHQGQTMSQFEVTDLSVLESLSPCFPCQKLATNKFSLKYIGFPTKDVTTRKISYFDCFQKKA